MDGLGDAIAEAVGCALLAAFALGLLAGGIVWVLWHYVFVHVSLGWR